MNRGRDPFGPEPRADLGDALESLGAAELRALIRELLGELGGPERDRMIDRLLARAARRGLDLTLHGPDDGARRIFATLLLPIAERELDLGYFGTPEEALGVDVGECVRQAVVSVYLTTAPERRAEAVRTAILDTLELGPVREPLAEMERVAIEPLAGLDDFLPRWRLLLGQTVAAGEGGERRRSSRSSRRPARSDQSPWRRAPRSSLPCGRQPRSASRA